VNSSATERSEWQDLTDDEIRPALKQFADSMIKKAIEFGAAEATSTFEGHRGDDVLTVADLGGGLYAAVWVETTAQGPQVAWMVRRPTQHPDGDPGAQQ
jgi:hypothetical protein